MSTDNKHSGDLVCKHKCQETGDSYTDPRRWSVPWLPAEIPLPVTRKEIWKADPTTWLDWDTSMLSLLPTELFVDFIFPSLLSVDLSMFLLSLGYNQYTSDFRYDGQLKKYTYIAPLPRWISDWLWDHRAYTHVTQASRSMGWNNSGNYADWCKIRRRVQFDGDDPPEVYKKRRIEKGCLW